MKSIGETSQANCRIMAVGTRRNGSTRYWCLRHKGNATAKYGRAVQYCRYAHVRPVSPAETLKLDVFSYGGGVAVWGTVPPIVDTTRLPTELGVHVHARRSEHAPKEVDRTFRLVVLSAPLDAGTARQFVISEFDAIYCMVSSIFGFSTKYLAGCGKSRLGSGLPGG
jgi:hypothetical protein